MNLAAARAIVRQFARNAADEANYTQAEVDIAIQAVLDDFVWHTRCLISDDEQAIEEDDESLSVEVTNFRAERIVRAYFEAWGDVEIIEHSLLLKKRVADAAVGRPLYIAFSTPTTLHVYPQADDDCTLRLVWIPPITSFTPGVEAASGVTLDLPDDYLRLILAYGATALLQHTESEARFASDSWQKYEAFRNRMSGRGHLGAKTIERLGAEF